MYFFDFFDGATDQVDVAGTRYRDEEAAIQAARIMLSDRALLEVLKGGEVVATIRVRRNTTPIFSATFSLTEEHYRLDS